MHGSAPRVEGATCHSGQHTTHVLRGDGGGLLVDFWCAEHEDVPLDVPLSRACLAVVVLCTMEASGVARSPYPVGAARHSSRLQCVYSVLWSI